MEQLVADGKMEMLVLVDEDEFAGLAINLIDEEQNRALLDYYAIAPEKRNGGYGAKGWKCFWNALKIINIFLRLKHRMKKRRMQKNVREEKHFILRNGSLKETGLFCKCL